MSNPTRYPRPTFRPVRWFTPGPGACGLALLLFAAACEQEVPFEPLPPVVGSLNVRAYLDYDGQPGFGGQDEAAPGIRVELLLPGSETTIASGVTDGDGRVEVVSIPVGTYDVRVDPAFLGDSLIVVDQESTRITFRPGEGFDLNVGVTPPSYSISEVRDLPEGTRSWISGVALNSRSASVDGAIHVISPEGEALRAEFPQAVGGTYGDSVRVLGTTASSGSRRYLEATRINIIARDVRRPLPLEVDLDAIPTAGGGELDARLVTVRAGVVADTSVIPFVGVRVRVRDGARQFEALLPIQNGFGVQSVELEAPVESITGLLSPDPDIGSTWLLVPRRTSDVALGEPPEEEGTG